MEPPVKVITGRVRDDGFLPQMADANFDIDQFPVATQHSLCLWCGITTIQGVGVHFDVKNGFESIRPYGLVKA